MTFHALRNSKEIANAKRFPKKNSIYCKMIENSMPIYILPIFAIDPSKNKEIIELLIKEFFKSYIELSFNIE